MGNSRRYRNCVGPQIRRMRVSQRLSQEELSVKLQLAGLGLDRTSVVKIEAGLRSVFDYELAVIAQQLKTTTDLLYPSWSDLQGALPDLLKGEKLVRTRKV